MPFLIAHAGHWLLWVVYAAPALIVLGATIRAVVAQRKEQRQEPTPPIGE